jgi:hypothetical protein
LYLDPLYPLEKYHRNSETFAKLFKGICINGSGRSLKNFRKITNEIHKRCTKSPSIDVNVSQAGYYFKLPAIVLYKHV